ncbi:MAG: YggS family pyridoxal phosphate-dependent enzyme [Candidatus Goldbacteria bacterium]|nr:YggS family pyridoxal phosphate-dependent enzyme [Candidatus Goldiibacteriota bacterium]
MEQKSQIKNNIESIIKRINAINKDALLVAVSKTFSVDDIEEAVKSGVKVFGESKIQEAEEKQRLLNEKYNDLSWFMIGHLQTNKVNKAVSIFNMIQSVDSLKLAEKINSACIKEGKVMQCLMEIKVSPEETKFGILPEEAPEVYGRIKEMPGIKPSGIMAMAPYSDNAEDSRIYFKRAKKVFDEIKNGAPDDFKWLSMGMSHDFEIALQEGANMVRVGTSLFGKRNYA